MQSSLYHPVNRLIVRNAGGTWSAGTIFTLFAGLCLLGTLPSLDAEPAQENSSFPARVQVSPYAPDKLPYHLRWGAYTVVAEIAAGKDRDGGDQQVRIVDASGHLLCRIGADRVQDIRLVKPLVASEQGLLISTAGGNSGLGNYYGFGVGASNRFHVSDAIQVDVKDLNGDGTAEIIAVYRIEDMDGGGEHHGPQVTVVYQWNGTKYVQATRIFPALTRTKEKEYQAALLAIAAKASQSNAAPGKSEPEIDGHLNAIVGYAANAIMVGDQVEAQAWLKDNISAALLRLSSEVSKSARESIQSMLRPLAQDSGYDAIASPPAPNTPVSNTAAPDTAQYSQGAKAGFVPGQSLGILTIGEAREDVIAAIKMRPTANFDLKHGLVEDDWTHDSTGGSDTGYNISVWYRHGKVVQAETSLTEQQRGNVPSFNTLVALDRSLQEVCYSMSCYDDSGQPTGGANCYCFDNIKRGITYAVNVNGEAYTTSKPDTLIIHVAGVPYIPFCGLTNVTRFTGAASILYQNQVEEDKAFALEKKRTSRAGANIMH